MKQIAKSYAALWALSVPPGKKLIGEAIAFPNATFSVGPERRYGLGGPFTSVTSYLEGWIKLRLTKLQEQGAIDEYKERYLDRILRFVESIMGHIPRELEDVKLSLMNTDFGYHNMILSDSGLPSLKWVIDWEFVADAPPLIIIPIWLSLSSN